MKTRTYFAYTACALMLLIAPAMVARGQAPAPAAEVAQIPTGPVSQPLPSAAKKTLTDFQGTLRGLSMSRAAIQEKIDATVADATRFLDSIKRDGYEINVDEMVYVPVKPPKKN